MGRKSDSQDGTPGPEQDLDGELRAPVWKYLSRFHDLLGVLLVGFLLLVWYAAAELEQRDIDSPTTYFVVIAIIAVAITTGFWLTRRRERQAITRFNLKCAACGYTPASSEIAVTQAMQECQKCHEPLHA